MPIAGIFPTVAGDSKSASNASGRKHDRLCFEQFKAASLALVGKSANDSFPFFEEREHRAFHVDVNPSVNSMVLQGADHLQASAISYMSQTRISVTAEITLK